MSEGDALILDIDGTLLEQLFKNVSKDQVLSKEFLDKLASAEPYPFVKTEIVPLARRADRILVVTGRQQEMAQMTKRWVAKAIGTNDFTIKFVNYKDYNQYLEDKMKILRNAFSDFDDLGYHIVMYEDDETITRWAKSHYDWVETHKVINGKPSKV